MKLAATWRSAVETLGSHLRVRASTSTLSRLVLSAAGITIRVDFVGQLEFLDGVSNPGLCTGALVTSFT